MKYPEHLLEQIRQQSDIVELVGEFVALRQRGNSFIGLCPFHSEKTPSFNVSRDKGIFKCFGCGKGGNVFTFLTEHQKLTFPEAVKELAARAGVHLPDAADSEEDRQRASRFEMAFKALREAANFYYASLWTDDGAAAQEYLRRRGFTEESIRDFGLGMAPDSWDALSQELRRLGFAQEQLVDAGLVIPRESSGYYDRFRGRLMFPILNAMGRVIGFGARTMSADAKQAKYINSPQSLVYDKSKALYGIHHARDAMRRDETVLMVEGYADVISLHQAGFKNVVASSGTALTRDQVQAIKRYCPKLYLIYDADSAGANAAMKGMDLALAEGMDVYVVRLPEGQDPDSYILQEGPKAFTAVLKKAMSFVDFKGDVFRAQGSFETAEGQAEAVRSLVSSIARIPDHLKRDVFIRNVAAKFGIQEKLLYEEMSQIQRRQQLQLRRSDGLRRSLPPTGEPGSNQAAPSVGSSPGIAPAKVAEPPPETTAVPPSAMAPAEEKLLRVALGEPRLLAYIAEQLSVRSATFINEHSERLFTQILTAAEQHADPAQKLLSPEALDEQDRELVSKLCIEETSHSPNWQKFNAEISNDPVKIVNDSISSLLLTARQREHDSLQAQLKTASPAEQGQILLRLRDLKNELLELEGSFSAS